MYEYCNDIFCIASALNMPIGMRTPVRYGLNTITEFSMAFLVQMYIYVEFRPTTMYVCCDKCHRQLLADW